MLSVHLHLLLLILRWPLQDFSDLFLVDGLACIVKFEFILRTSHAEDFEAIDLWNELRCWRKGLIKVLQKMLVMT